MAEITERLVAFVGSAPPGSLRALTALAAPESLSDELAQHLIELACPGQLRLDAFVSALHLGGFLIERNSEWHISHEERAFLNSELLKDGKLFLQCHGFLAGVAEAREPTRGAMEVPVYLLGPVGRAYHHAAVSPEEGLALYRDTSSGPLAQQWLAARLASEQQELGILPSGAIEPAFLRGMVLYREGAIDQAMRVLRPVAHSEEVRQEVAIAAHLVGRQRWKRSEKEAEGLLRRSLKILEAIGDRHGQAQVLHTLGQNLWRRNPEEAEGLLRRSLEIGEAIGHRHHQAQVLHTLGQNLWRRNPEEAEGLLRRSLKILEAIGDRHGQAQVLHTLGQNLWRRNPEEAERLLRRSLKILEAIGDRHGQAQVLHTLGQNLWRRNPEEAERLLRRSLEIGEAIGHRHHQAQVLHTLGLNLSAGNPSEAEELLRRSLAIGEDLRNMRHQAIVLLTLGKLFWPTDPAQGRALMLRSLKLERRSRNRSGEEIVLREMRRRGIDQPAG